MKSKMIANRFTGNWGLIRHCQEGKLKQGLFAFLFLILSISPLGAQGFLKVSGKKILAPDGNEIILRGMGLGGWMLQEPYMMQMSGIAANQTAIREKIHLLIGEGPTNEFYDAWLKNFVTKQDIDTLAKYGFNSIRLPMHYNLFTLPIEQETQAGVQTWLERGFDMTDSLLSWCRDNKMYLILDLHAAPGGQGKDQAISDYTPSRLSLWESDENKAKTIALWKKLAERYAEEEWIGAYDVINEPNWSFGGANQNGCDEQTNIPLKELLMGITSAIREVDTNHIIIIEGNCWGNNYNGLTPPWDKNMVYSFHKYWSANMNSTIQGILNIRSNHNVPLWLGESGENSNHWFAEAIRLAETNGIGWAWWPLKKIESVAGPYSITKTPEYQLLLNYWAGKAGKPTQSYAQNALMDLSQKILMDSCTFSPDVFDAMFRQPFDITPKPYAQHRIPGMIKAAEYDIGRNGYAYSDKDYQNTGGAWDYNKGYAGRNDGVDLEKCNDLTKGYNVGWIETGEWMKYTVEVDQDSVYDVEIRYASQTGGGIISLEIDGLLVVKQKSLSATGGWQSWRSVFVQGVTLSQGKHTLKIKVDNGGFNLNYVKFLYNTNNSIEQISTQDIIIAPGHIRITNPALHGYSLRIYDGLGRVLYSGYASEASCPIHPSVQHQLMLISLTSRDGKRVVSGKYIIGG